MNSDLSIRNAVANAEEPTGAGLFRDSHDFIEDTLHRILRLCVAILVLSMAPALSAGPQYAATVIDADSGYSMYEANSRVRTQPASLTKIMTAYLVFSALENHQIEFSTPLFVTSHAAAMEPSRLGLRPGQRILLRDALQATITKSANDAAVVLAESLGGTESNFARMMNAQAERLGLVDTHFVNASGLSAVGQHTTARDMAILAKGLLKRFPRYYPLFGVTEFQYAGVTHRTHNHLLRRYAGSDGIKTGYVRASGYNLVASARRHGRRLIAVVLGGYSAYWRDRHIMNLMDNGFTALAHGSKSSSVLASNNSNFANTPLVGPQAHAATVNH